MRVSALKVEQSDVENGLHTKDRTTIDRRSLRAFIAAKFGGVNYLIGGRLGGGSIAADGD